MRYREAATIIKDSVSMVSVCHRYGIQLNDKGFASCNLHGEKTASMKAYEGNRGFYCFGCHRGGSVIDWTALSFGLDFGTSVRKLNDDFMLRIQLDCDAPRTNRDRQAESKALRLIEEANLKQKERDRLQRRYDNALTVFSLIDKLVMKASNKRCVDDMSEDMIFAIKHRDQALYELNCADIALYEFAAKSK